MIRFDGAVVKSGLSCRSLHGGPAMTHAAFATAGFPAPLSVDYQPGVCNIGPAEIARRRRAGHIGLIAAVALFAVLVAVGAPPIARLLVAIPAIISASG